ncbi:MAG TPA: MazG-like family protein [Burkholderiales bacterium]|nr:MazG-like family protein [Burkholderiales bacterium]
MDVKALQARLAAFAAERGWDELHNPRNLAIALAGEAGMLLDLFRWLNDAQSQRIESEYKREAAEEAIADLVLHTLRLADKLGVDVERAVAKKLAENDANYPLPVAEAPAHTERPTAVVAPEPKPHAAKKETPPPGEQKRATPPAAPAEPAPVPEAAPKPQPEKKEAAAPAERKMAPPPERGEPAPALEAREPKPTAESPKPSSEKEVLPSWLDGIMPARAGAARKKPVAGVRPAPEPPKAAAPPRAPEPPPVARVVEEIAAMPPPAAPEPEAEPVEAPWEPGRYSYLDTDAAKGFVKSLAKRVDSARSDDPLLRELHDEVETLRRTLYSPMPKRSWMGDSLKTIRAILEEASTHSVSDEIRARDYMAQIDRILNP